MVPVSLSAVISILVTLCIEESVLDLYERLNARLSKTKFLAGDKYTIADIATWPWIARHEWHDIGLSKFESLSKWYMNIAERDAVVKGYNFMGAGEIPKP